MRPPARPGLDQAVRHLVSISALAALGRDAELDRYLRVALQSGLKREQVAEALFQIALLAGLPRAISALECLQAASDEEGWTKDLDVQAPFAASEDLRARGGALFAQVYAGLAGSVLRHLSSLHPALPDWVLTGAYGAILSREVLPLKFREYVSVSALVALGETRQLMAHLRGALRAGGTPEELREVLSQLSLHFEEAQVVKALELLERAAQPP